MFSVLRHSSANAKPKSEKKFLSDFDKRAASEVTKCFMRLLPHGSVSERTFPVINIPHLFDYLIRQTSVRRRDKHNDFCRVDGEKSRKIISCHLVFRNKFFSEKPQNGALLKRKLMLLWRFEINLFTNVGRH